MNITESMRVHVHAVKSMHNAGVLKLGFVDKVQKVSKCPIEMLIKQHLFFVQQKKSIEFERKYRLRLLKAVFATTNKISCRYLEQVLRPIFASGY